MQSQAWRFAPIVAILAVLPLVLMAVAPAAAAAPVELTKVTLPETSPTGPALWTAGAGSSSSAFNAVLAWTGADAAHHVNLRTSSDGLHYGPTVTLGETAISRPAVTVIAASAAAPRTVILAWTGRDARHSLNVLFDVFNVTSHRSKLTFADTSFTGPAIVNHFSMVFENLLLGWTGTDANHSLNLRELDFRLANNAIVGLTVGPKTILPRALNSNVGPALAAVSAPDFFDTLLTWTSTATRLSLASVQNPSQPQTDFVSPQTSFATPSVLGENVPFTANPPQLHFWWAWTGTNARRSLNLMDSGSLTSWVGPITTFAETASGGPSLGSVGVARQLLLAWTGTDAAHHLNVATISV